MPAPRIARLVAQRGGIAEAAQRRAPRFRRAHSGGNILGDLPVEVKIDFVVQLLAGAVAAKQHLAAHKKFV